MRVLAHPCVPRLFDVMHSVRFVHLVTEDGGADLFELLARHHERQQAEGLPDNGLEPVFTIQ